MCRTLPIHFELAPSSYPNAQHPLSFHLSPPVSIPPKPKLLKLIGNMQENIEQILQAICCHCGAEEEFRKVAMVYCAKIEKLRKERNDCKQKYQTLKKKNRQLQMKEQWRQKNLQYQQFYQDWPNQRIVNSTTRPQQRPLQQNQDQQVSEQNLLLSQKSSFSNLPQQLPFFQHYLPPFANPSSRSCFRQSLVPFCKKYQNSQSHSQPSQLSLLKKSNVDPVKLYCGVSKTKVEAYIENQIWDKQIQSAITQSTNFQQFCKYQKTIKKRGENRQKNNSHRDGVKRKNLELRF